VTPFPQQKGKRGKDSLDVKLDYIFVLKDMVTVDLLALVFILTPDPGEP